MARIRGQPRKNARLPGYNYSLPGAYFVTIVSRGRELVFDDLRLKAAVEEAWQWLGQTFGQVRLDAFVVMPNHVHGVLFITDSREGRWQAAPTNTAAKPLGIRGTPMLPVWQRNYYERVVRDEEELNRVRQYIIDNPARWGKDPENPKGELVERLASRPQALR